MCVVHRRVRVRVRLRLRLRLRRDNEPHGNGGDENERAAVSKQGRMGGGKHSMVQTNCDGTETDEERAGGRGRRTDEGRSANDVERGNTEQPASAIRTHLRAQVEYEPLRVKRAVLLEDLSHNRNGRVDWVRDDQDESIGRGGGNASGKIANDASVDLNNTSMSMDR